jgi:hypothetical protein
MRYVTIAFSGLLLLGAGCAAPGPGQYDKIAQQLEDINKNLSAMTRSYEDYNRLLAAAEQNAVETGTGVIGRENLYMLRRIRKLPAKPTDQQIRQYVEKILAAAGDTYFPENSLPLRMLRAVGPEHLEVLLPFLKGGEGALLLEQVLPDLVAPGDKALVLEHLKEIPVLAVAAIRQGWGNDAKNEIFEILEDAKYRSRLIPYAKTLVQTPADRERIVNLYIQQPNSSGLYPMIREFPDIDVLSINNRAWARQKEGPEAAQYAMRAAETGNVEALGYLINGYFDRNREKVFDGADILLIKLTGLPLDRKIMNDWYQGNKDKLYIDEKSGRFSTIE